LKCFEGGIVEELMKKRAEKAVRSTHWTWMAGMRVGWPSGAESGWTWMRLSEAEDGTVWGCIARRIKLRDSDGNPMLGGAENHGPLHPCARPDSGLPDLRDAATIGCLIELVRKAWGPVSLSTDEGMGRAHVSIDTGSFTGSRVFSGPTLEFCLVEALLAVPTV
jgi:hypothetical protein